MVVSFSKTNILAMLIVVFVDSHSFAKQNDSFHSQTQSKASAMSVADARLALIKVSDEADGCMKKQKYHEAVERYHLVIRQAENADAGEVCTKRLRRILSARHFIVGQWKRIKSGTVQARFRC